MHRIQRVPVTEKRGRRHSSEVTVVWLDERRRDAPRLDRSTVRVDTMRGSGPGGQHRNKTDSGVRLVHHETGIIVTATEDRSQHVNREVAWKRLERRLADLTAVADHDAVNDVRNSAMSAARAWTWTDWRDEVKGPERRRASMNRVLAGRIELLL